MPDDEVGRIATGAMPVLAVGQTWRPERSASGARRITRIDPGGTAKLRYMREDGSEAWWVTREEFRAWINESRARLVARTGGT